MQRIQYIDRLKGLAIILVVMGHVFGFSPPDDGIIAFIYTFHMPLFMFLSGLVIAAPPTLSKVLAKWRRFLVPFFVVGLAFALYRGVSVAGFFRDGSKCGYWYLWVLAIFYLILSAFRFVGGGKRGLIADMLLFFVVYVIFLAVLRGFNIVGYDDILSINLCADMFPFFMFGYLARKYRLFDFVRRYPTIAGASVVAYIIAFVAIEFGGCKSMIVYNLSGLAMVIVLVYAFSARERSSSTIERQLGLVGRYSLEIYVLHYFFIQNLHVEFIQSWALATHNGLLELLFLIVVSVTITCLCMAVGWLLRQLRLI